MVKASRGNPPQYRHVPFPSSIRITKYLLESVTLSTAMPGNCSTGAWAKSSPEKEERERVYAVSLRHLPPKEEARCHRLPSGSPEVLSSSLMKATLPLAVMRSLPLHAGCSSCHSAALGKEEAATGV